MISPVLPIEPFATELEEAIHEADASVFCNVAYTYPGFSGPNTANPFNSTSPSLPDYPFYSESDVQDGYITLCNELTTNLITSISEQFPKNYNGSITNYNGDSGIDIISWSGVLSGSELSSEVVYDGESVYNGAGYTGTKHSYHCNKEVELKLDVTGDSAGFDTTTITLRFDWWTASGTEAGFPPRPFTDASFAPFFYLGNQITGGKGGPYTPTSVFGSGALSVPASLSVDLSYEAKKLFVDDTIAWYIPDPLNLGYYKIEAFPTWIRVAVENYQSVTMDGHGTFGDIVINEVPPSVIYGDIPGAPRTTYDRYPLITLILQSGIHIVSWLRHFARSIDIGTTYDYDNPLFYEQHDIIVRPDGILIATSKSGLRKASEDDGETWQSLT